MDEEGDSTGIGSLAAFQLGRWSAEQSQWVQDWKDSIHNPVVAKVDYDYAVRLNQTLAADNRQLCAELATAELNVEFWKENHRKLKEWADAVEAELDFYRETDPNRKLF